MENLSHIIHDLNGHVASLSEGIKLLNENKTEEFNKKILTLMENKCNDLMVIIEKLSQRLK